MPESEPLGRVCTVRCGGCNPGLQAGKRVGLNSQAPTRFGKWVGEGRMRGGGELCMFTSVCPLRRRGLAGWDRPPGWHRPVTGLSVLLSRAIVPAGD